MGGLVYTLPRKPQEISNKTQVPKWGLTPKPAKVSSWKALAIYLGGSAGKVESYAFFFDGQISLHKKHYPVDESKFLPKVRRAWILTAIFFPLKTAQFGRLPFLGNLASFHSKPVRFQENHYLCQQNPTWKSMVGKWYHLFGPRPISRGYIHILCIPTYLDLPVWVPKCFRYRVSINHPVRLLIGTPTGRCWYIYIYINTYMHMNNI